MIVGLAACILAATGHPAEIPPDVVTRGKEIVEAARKQNAGFQSLSANVKMTLVNRRGQSHERRLKMHMLEREEGGRYSRCLVKAPPDVRGTVLLSHSLPDTASNQWLYLPALHRTRRIAAQARSGAFMGSEFSYEDLIGHPLDQGRHRWLRDTNLENRHCHVLEWVPLDPRSSGYYRQVVWVDSQYYRVWRVDYYNRRQERQKTLTLNDYRLYNEQFWYATEMNMLNHLSGNRTKLEWSTIVIGAKLSPVIFAPERLGNFEGDANIRGLYPRP